VYKIVASYQLQVSSSGKGDGGKIIPIIPILQILPITK
jgi:hypothetical protein